MASSINTVFKKNLFAQFPWSTTKLALYSSAVPAVDVVTAYTATGETSGSGYAAGGQAVTVTYGSSGTVGIADIVDVSWTGTFTTLWGLLYNTASIDGVSNSAIAVLDWGGSKSVAGGTFTVDFPASGAATSTLQLA